MPELERPFLVKVCGITREEDARTAIESGAKALGFNFYTKSPRYISPESAKQIVQAVPGDYMKVGVFVNATEAELERISAEVPLDVVQLHGEHSAMPVAGYIIWRALTAGSSLPEPGRKIEAYLLDSHSPGYGGSGKTFDWALAERFPYRKILAGGLDGANVAEAIATVRPCGVDACSRLESQPGKKDPERVRAFVAAALAAAEKLNQSPERSDGCLLPNRSPERSDGCLLSNPTPERTDEAFSL